jgi:hypothetical protein
VYSSTRIHDLGNSKSEKLRMQLCCYHDNSLKACVSSICNNKRSSSRTQEIDAVVAIAEPAGGPRRGEIDAVVREVGPRHGCARQIVVVADVRRRVAENVNRRHLAAAPRRSCLRGDGNASCRKDREKQRRQ